MITHSELLAGLAELADLNPGMRAGPLIAAVGELCVDLHGRGMRESTDAELLEATMKRRQLLTDRE